MNKSSNCALLAALLCLLVAGFAQAQEKKMYSWTDENGTVHFSDKRPEGQDVVEQSIPQEAAPVSADPYQQGESGPSLAEQRRQEIARKSQEAQVMDAVNSVQCSSWQAELERIEPNRRVFYTNAQGETVRMDDVERANRVDELKAQISRNCK